MKPGILDEIVEAKRLEVLEKKARVSPVAMRRMAEFSPLRPRGFWAGLRKTKEKPAIIAEIKGRSPSKGILAPAFDPVATAVAFEQFGASSLSVLTDEPHFGGRLEFLKQIRNAVELPLLRKDFILDEYQIHETVAAGADAVLLIAEILTPDEIEALFAAARAFELDVLLEFHSLESLNKVKHFKNALFGINNRDLTNFKTDLGTTRRLRLKLPKNAFVVAESGIKTRKDLLLLKKMKIDAILVGEVLMIHENPGKALRSLKTSS